MRTNTLVVAWVAALMILTSCTIQRKARESEPIGPYHILEGGISLRVSECQHYYVLEATPVTDTLFTFELLEIIGQIKEAMLWPCYCIHCNKENLCYR